MKRLKFDYSLNFKTLNFRKKQSLYRIGRGEQGVLLVEPYKSEILPHWKFKTPKEAKTSARHIYKMFLVYLKNNDFVGADMARKFLQMGYTRARRYANHPSGKKYRNLKSNKKEILPQALDWKTNEKAQAAEIFYNHYHKARENKKYKTLTFGHLEKFESGN